MTRELLTATRRDSRAVVAGSSERTCREEGPPAIPIRRLQAVLPLVACLLLALLTTGCARNKLTAQTLPDEYRARPVENAQTVNLSRLATARMSNEFIDYGDVLDVTIAAGLAATDTTTIPVRVSENGSASLPIIGPVQLGGLELEAAEQAISAACTYRGIYRAPHVTVTMKKQRMNRVTVLGGVAKEGEYSLPRGSSNLLAAIVAAGGLSEDAGTYVEIRQPQISGNTAPRPPVIADGPGDSKLTGYSRASAPGSTVSTSTQARTIRVNLVTAAKEGRGGQVIEDGGVVMVEKRDPTPVQIIGLVNKPGRYPFPVGQDLRVLDAVAMASGTSSKLADKIIVSRPLANGADPAVIPISIAKAKRNREENLLLQPGDVVSVEQTPATIMMDAIQIIRFGVSASLAPLY